MPVHRTAHQSCAITRHALIGVHRLGTDFVSHVGLASGESRLKSRGSVPVIHVRPPLRFGDSIRADLVGMAELTAQQREGLQRWLERTESERGTTGLDALSAWDEYVVCPPWDEVTDAQGRRLYRRFSCSGFVACAYLEGAGVALVDLDALPAVPWGILQPIYAPRGTLEPLARAEMGLAGEGPWAVLLPGYLFHAVARGVLTRPYRAEAGNERF